MRLSTKQVSGITPCMNNRQEYAYEYLFMCKGKTSGFFLVCYCLQTLKHLRRLLRLIVKIIRKLEIFGFNFAYFLCGYLLSILTFLILMKITCKVDLSAWKRQHSWALKVNFFLTVHKLDWSVCCILAGLSIYSWCGYLKQGSPAY